jgi:hypothetical protein
VPDMQISRSDIEQLAQKLDAIGPDFTDREWMLLAAVFAAATDAASRVRLGAGAEETAVNTSQPATLRSWTADDEDDDEGDVRPAKIGRASLRDQVLRSFIPGDADEDDSQAASKKIGNA